MDVAFANGQSLKTTLEGFSPQQFDALKQVATYYRLVQSLRTTGWTNLFWGGLTLWLGTSAFRPNIFTNIQAILGVLIVAQSLWAITRPGRNSLRALMSILLLCGLWNLFITFYGRFNGVDLLVGMLGAAQLWWAYRTYKSYQLFSELPAPEPTPELIQQYNTIWEGLSHPSPALSPELMMMQLNRNRHWWNGMLLPNHAILAHKRQKVLMFVSKPDLTLVSENPKAVNREKFAIFAQIGKDSLTGKIYRNSFQQYLNWKGITDSESEISPRIVRKRLIHKIAWWVMVGILVLIVLYITALVSFAMKYA